MTDTFMKTWEFFFLNPSWQISTIIAMRFILFYQLILQKLFIVNRIMYKTCVSYCKSFK